MHNVIQKNTLLALLYIDRLTDCILELREQNAKYGKGSLISVHIQTVAKMCTVYLALFPGPSQLFNVVWKPRRAISFDSATCGMRASAICGPASCGLAIDNS